MADPGASTLLRALLLAGLTLAALALPVDRATAQCGEICDAYTLQIPDPKGKGGDEQGDAGAAPSSSAAAGTVPGPDAEQGAEVERVPHLKPLFVPTPAKQTGGSGLAFERRSASAALFGTLGDPVTAVLLASLLIGAVALGMRGRRLDRSGS